jgi:hypothetical protein
MDLLKIGLRARLMFLVAICLLAVPVISSAEEYRTFTSEEYGFSMKYPASWVKIDKPKGNYYVVFQSPDLTDNFRDRIHVAAHEPVKDPLKVFLQELRNGIKDLQNRAGKGAQDAQQVKILDEGEFKCDVPGAYYFFIQALEDKLKMWMDIVIVFYKHDQTLLRVSCLAPSTSMEKMQGVFNDVLVSIAFNAPQKSSTQPAPPRPAPPTYQAEEETAQPPVAQPAPAAPPRPTPQQPPASTGPAFQTPPNYLQQEQPQREAPPRPAPRPEQRRGPGRAPEPGTGIVN